MNTCLDCGGHAKGRSTRCLECHKTFKSLSRQRILDLHDQGWSYDEIAEDRGMKRGTVIEIIRVERGPRHSPVIVREMAEAIYDGKDPSFFAHKYGFTREHILKVTSCYRQQLKKHHDNRLMKRIKQLVSDTMLVCPSLISSRSRNARVTKARKVVYYIGMSIGVASNDVGKFLSRDHSTVVEGKRDIEKLIFTDDLLRRRIENIERIVRSERFAEPIKIVSIMPRQEEDLDDIDDMDLLSMRVAQHYK